MICEYRSHTAYESIVLSFFIPHDDNHVIFDKIKGVSYNLREQHPATCKVKVAAKISQIQLIIQLAIKGQWHYHINPNKARNQPSI